MPYAANIIDTANELMGKLGTDELKQLFQYFQDNGFGANTDIKTIEELIISVRFAEHVYCPHCGCVEVVPNGHTRKGSQRWKCTGCGKTFTATTKSIFEKCKLTLQQLKKLIECMFDKKSVNETRNATGLATKTILDWRHKFGYCLNTVQEQEIKLGQIVEADETYMRVSYKGNHYMPDRPALYVPCKSNDEREDIESYYRRTTGQDVKVGYRRKGRVAVYIGTFKRDPSAFVMPREPRYGKGKKKMKRGLSTEQQCFVCAVDRDHNSIALPVGVGNCRLNQIETALFGKIEAQSVLCTDAKQGYETFALSHNYEHHEFKGSYRVNGIYGIQNINNYHNFLKNFVYGPLNGVTSKHAQDYVSLHNFAIYSRNAVNVNNMDYKIKHLLQICAMKLVNVTGKMIGKRQPIYSICA